MPVAWNAARCAFAAITVIILVRPALAQVEPHPSASRAPDPFPSDPVTSYPVASWNAGSNKSAIIQFVTWATDPSSANYLPPVDRGVRQFRRRRSDAAMDGEGNRPYLTMLVFHDDTAREYASGPVDDLPDTALGTFSPWLMNEARMGRWQAISMKNDGPNILSPP